MAERAAYLPSREASWGWTASGIVHGCVLAVLAMDAAWPFLDFLYDRRPVVKPAVAIEARLIDEDATDLAGEGPTSPPAMQFARTAYPIELVDLGLITNTRASDSEAATDRRPQDVFSERVDAKVATAISSAQNLTPDEQRDRLATLAGQLKRVSSERSIDDLAGRFQKWLGTDKRAEQPADGPVAGEFDLSTAQLHEVRRERDEAGQYRYVSVLVDAAGRKLETVLDPLEGESAYKTFQLIRANPLAELVYRRIAMSLLDNLIKAGEQAQQALPPVELPPAELPAGSEDKPAVP